MADRIRAGILGTGHGHAVGKLRVLQRSADWELAGVCEPDAEARARRQGEAAWAGVPWLDEAELLGDRSVRMIAVEGEVPQLLPMARRAVDAGKHLHLDKPPGADLEQFRAVLDEARRQALIVQLGYMFRYNPGFHRIRQAVVGGLLGRIHRVHGCISTDLRPDARRRVSFHPGGMMLELGCHLIDILVLLMGRPERVTSFLRHDGGANDDLADNTLAVFEFESALATIETACIETEPFPRREFTVVGDQGTLALQPLEPPALRLCLREPRGEYRQGWQPIAVIDIPRYERDLAELARCLRAGEPLPYSYEHDLIVQETVLRACGSV